MRFPAFFFVLAVLGLSVQAAEPPIECFTPGGDCTGLIVGQIDAAQKSVLVQAYSFTSEPIVQALVAAKRRGLDVHVILDKRDVCYRHGEFDADCHTADVKQARLLVAAGIPVLVDIRPAIAHNKVMIFDGAVVITGSFNFTKAAQERNAENVVLLRDPELAARYAANWKAHAGQSEEFGAGM